MNEFLRRNSPPGQNLACEKYTLLWGLAAAALFSLQFFSAFSQAYHDLFTEDGILQQGIMMAPFDELLGISLLGFGLLGLGMLQFGFYHWYYFYQDSKSIYLLKRLPQRNLLLRYCLTLPGLAFIVCILAMVLVRLVYFAVYLALTPDACLPTDVWQQFWRLLG